MYISFYLGKCQERYGLLYPIFRSIISNKNIYSLQNNFWITNIFQIMGNNSLFSKYQQNKYIKESERKPLRETLFVAESNFVHILRLSADIIFLCWINPRKISEILHSFPQNIFKEVLLWFLWDYLYILFATSYYEYFEDFVFKLQNFTTA